MTLIAAQAEPLPRLPNDFAGTRLFAFTVITVVACWLEKTPYGNTGSCQALLTWLALIAISIAVWHGAYDGTLSQPLFEPRIGRWWFFSFAAGYLLLVGATLIAWHVEPAFTLIAFLLYSSWHFGTEQDVERLTLGGAFSGLACGALPISAACYWHPNQVNTIFRAMLGSSAQAAFALDLTRSCAALLWGIVAFAAFGTVLGLRGKAPSTRLSGMSLIAVELLLFWCCDPLIAFAVYFCLWHTPEHLVSTSLDRKGVFTPRIMWQNLRAGIPPWIAALTVLALLLAFRPQSVTGYVSGLFVLLSALTVPHMGLNEMRRLARH